MHFVPAFICRCQIPNVVSHYLVQLLFTATCVLSNTGHNLSHNATLCSNICRFWNFFLATLRHLCTLRELWHNNWKGNLESRTQDQTPATARYVLVRLSTFAFCFGIFPHSICWLKRFDQCWLQFWFSSLLEKTAQADTSTQNAARKTYFLFKVCSFSLWLYFWWQRLKIRVLFPFLPLRKQQKMLPNIKCLLHPRRIFLHSLINGLLYSGRYVNNPCIEFRSAVDRVLCTFRSIRSLITSDTSVKSAVCSTH